jgi:hypothetical protein
LNGCFSDIENSNEPKFSVFPLFRASVIKFFLDFSKCPCVYLWLKIVDMTLMTPLKNHTCAGLMCGLLLFTGAIRAFASGLVPRPLAEVPVMTQGEPLPGLRVRQTEPDYAGTEVHHSLYLPSDFDITRRHPLIVEFPGNYFPPGGNENSGDVNGASLGFAATLGKQFVWIVLPFVSKDGTRNETTWWGDEEATVRYARSCVTRAMRLYNIDPERVVLCGFSRGAIAVSYIGLHDDGIATLWSAFMTHDHFDGVREWKKTSWGAPLEKYRREASLRLRRLNGRPVWVGQNGGTGGIELFLKTQGLSDAGRFQFETIPIKEMFPEIPNAFIRHPHTDLWPLCQSPAANRLRAWLGNVARIAGPGCNRK